MIVLLHDRKYQKSSKRFPLRNLPAISRFANIHSAPRLCRRTDFMHARHFFYAKSTLCFMYFCMTKSTKSHLRRSLLEISLSVPALPKCKHHIPSCANISSEPSDLGQRQKCRLKCTGCLLDFALCHADMAGDRASWLCQRTDFVHARHTFICGRGTSAYANLLDSFV